MVEFGEKVKQIRQEKGMTQQTMAEKLYVTRQAVSRWECGARYPDLLTAKKISQILEVSIDELLSGEELKENVEKEPLLGRPVENIMQTILYTIATVAYMLMCIFSLYSFIIPAKTPAGGITLVEIATCLGYIVSLAAVLTGLVLSAKNKLSAKVTGYIMWLPYIMAGISFLITFIDIKIKQNGYLGFSAWITDFTIPLLFGVYILLYFKLEEKRLPCWIVLLISFLTVGYLMLVLKRHFEFTTELGFAVSTVHGIGKIGRAVLLGYQAYIWEAKKKIAYRKKC